MNVRRRIGLYESRRSGILVTMRQVEEIFDVTTTTIHNWRKNAQFPVHHLFSPGIKKPPVRFDLGELLYWAEINKVEIKGDVQKIVGDIEGYKPIAKRTPDITVLGAAFG